MTSPGSPGVLAPVTNDPKTSVTTVLVCITCRGAGEPPDAEPRGAALVAAAGAALVGATDDRIQQVRCLANCDRGLSAALRREGTWTYIFGHLRAEQDGPALIEGARLLAESTDGLLPWRGRPDCLKKGLIARVPPADFQGEI